MNAVEEPIKRSRLRKLLGKEYYILKRRAKWLFDNTTYAQTKNEKSYNHLVFKHRSLVLRPLKDVDMYLQHNKRKNLEIAIQHLHHIEIKPGEVMSLWKLVGRPTQRKGYLEGLILDNGKIAKDIGGGLCQLGNLLFWLFAHSPLTIKERYRHSYDVFPDVNRKVPFGAGATLSYNYIDFSVKNETENTFKLELWLDDTYLNGALFAQKKMSRSYRVEERNHCIQQQHWGGYTRHNQIFQISKDANNNVIERLLVDNHAIMMYEPLLASGQKDKSR